MRRDLHVRFCEREGKVPLPYSTTEAPTAQRLQEAFASVGWHEFRRGDEIFCFPLEMNYLQQQMLGLLNIPVRDYR